MRARNNLDHWMGALLPAAGTGAQQAAATLLRALLVGFTTCRAQLARQSDRVSRVKTRRQWLSRWLSRPHWEAQTLYAALTRRTRRLLPRTGTVVLIFDFTDLGTKWRVLQVSLAFEGRAIVLYRIVADYAAPTIGQKDQVRQACAWLQEHLPGPRSRYVLVMDRGFPSHLLVRELTEGAWRFVIRIGGEWKLTHPHYTGRLHQASEQPGLVGPDPRCLRDAVLGSRGKGRACWSWGHVVTYHGERAKAPWFLVTTERNAARAVAYYRQRWQIECEFRDLKGASGLDQLASWHDREEVARFLALVAVYEWRLVHLWLTHQLAQWADYFQLKGKLSWWRITQLWLRHQLSPSINLALSCL